MVFIQNETGQLKGPGTSEPRDRLASAARQGRHRAPERPARCFSPARRARNAFGSPVASLPRRDDARACALVCWLGRGPRRHRRGSRAPPTRRGASRAPPGRASPARSPQRTVCPSRPSWLVCHCRTPRGLPSVAQAPLRHPRRSGGSGAAWRATRRRPAGASGLHGRAWRGGAQGASRGRAPHAPMEKKI